MPRKRFKKLNVSLNSLIIIALILISVFFVWQNTRLRSQIGSLQTQPAPTPATTAQPSPTPQPTQTPPKDGECVVTGCSGQICADEETITTCEYKEEYACYADAECTRQEDGECGWTPTNELLICLQNPLTTENETN